MVSDDKEVLVSSGKDMLGLGMSDLRQGIAQGCGVSPKGVHVGFL